jgi:hypothetical protein
MRIASPIARRSPFSRGLTAFAAVLATALLSSCSLRLGGSALPPPAAVAPSDETARRDAAFAHADAFFRVWLPEKMNDDEKAVLNGMARPMAIRLHDVQTGWQREWFLVPSTPGSVEVLVDGDLDPACRFALERSLFLAIASGEKGPRDALAAFRAGDVLVELRDNPAGLMPLLRVMLDFIARHPYP